MSFSLCKNVIMKSQLYPFYGKDTFRSLMSFVTSSSHIYTNCTLSLSLHHYFDARWACSYVCIVKFEYIRNVCWLKLPILRSPNKYLNQSSVFVFVPPVAQVYYTPFCLVRTIIYSIGVASQPTNEPLTMNISLIHVLIFSFALSWMLAITIENEWSVEWKLLGKWYLPGTNTNRKVYDWLGLLVPRRQEHFLWLRFLVLNTAKDELQRSSKERWNV